VEEAGVNFTIMATTPMVASWVNQVGGNRISATSIIPYSVDPHSYQPAARDIAQVTNAEYIFAVGLFYEDAWMNKLLDSHPDTILIELGDSVSAIKFQGQHHADSHDAKHSDSHDVKHGDSHDAKHGDSHDAKHGDSHDAKHGDSHDEGYYDPHFWFDPIRVSSAIEKIEEILSDLDPDGATYYAKRALEYRHTLQELDDHIALQIQSIPEAQRKLITEHESLGYLGERYKILILQAVIPNLSSETGPTPQDLAEAINIVREHNVPVIFVETETTGKSAERIAEETGVRVAAGLSVETLSEGQSYIDFMKYNLEVIVSNLVE
jgi:ABC-type Zn uptake system ZnuABC Zn-binding protein ZnuA